jgi:hypothetical protein
VTFDKPLAPASFAGTVFASVLAAKIQAMGLASTSGTDLSISRIAGVPIVDTNYITYLGGQPLLKGTNGYAVAPWSRFPVT